MELANILSKCRLRNQGKGPLGELKSEKFPVDPGQASTFSIGVRAGGARGAAAPPNFGQLRFFGQREKIWAKSVFKDVSVFFKSLF